MIKRIRAFWNWLKPNTIGVSGGIQKQGDVTAAQGELKAGWTLK